MFLWSLALNRREAPSNFEALRSSTMKVHEKFRNVRGFFGSGAIGLQK